MTHLFWKICFFISVCISSVYGQNQPYKFKQITVESGLSHASINHIIQDQAGCIWFATQFGLNRFDGKRFDKFLPNSREKNSLKSWFIQTIYQDSKGQLWVGTHVKGLHRFQAESQDFVQYKIPHKGEVIFDARVILEDNEGLLLIGTSKKGLYFLDPTLDKLLPISQITPIPKALKHAKINTLLLDNTHQIWVGTQEHGLFIWSKDRKNWTHIPFLLKGDDPNGSENIRTLYQDKESVIWMGTERGLFYRRKKEEDFHHLNMPDFTVPQIGNIYVRSILEDSYGKLWVGAEGGLYLFHKEDSTFSSFLHDPDNSHSISNNDIISIMEDRSGVLWLGLDNGGINYLDERENPFHFLGSQKYSEGLPLDVQMARSITQLRDGRFLVGTMNGGLRYCNSSYQDCEIFIRSTPNIPIEFSNKIYSTWQSREGKVWVADEDNEIFQFFPEERRLIPYSYSLCQSLSPAVDKNLGINYFDFYEDPMGQLWALSLSKDQRPGGVYAYLAEQDSFVCWKEIIPFSHLIPSQDIYSMAIQGDIFWLGTTEGLFKLDTQNGNLEHFSKKAGDINGLNNNHIRRLHLDQQGILWIGSLAQLHTLNTHTGEWESRVDPKGWLGGGVMAIEEDDRGNIWLSCQQGILKAHYSGDIVAYGIEDGLKPVHEFYMYSSFKNPNTGHIMFGGGGGFISFHPDSVRENPYTPPVVISKLTKYQYKRKGELLSKKEVPLIGKKELTLSYSDRILIFEVAALNYYKGNKNQHKYKLEGFQEDWIELGNENKFTLTNLDPGGYTLLVKGSNNDGKWNEHPTQLSIKVLPPWWKTLEAYFAYLLLTVSALSLGIFLVHKKVIEKNKQELRDFELTKLKELDSQRSQFFANISHDFRTPLTLIETPVREQLNILQNEGELYFGRSSGKKFFTRILRNCSSLMFRINQIMKLSQLESGLLPLKASKQDLVVMLEHIYAQFESLAEKRKIEFSLQSDQEELMVYMDAEKMETIFLNLMSNAFKYTPIGEKITINLTSSKEKAEVAISNTGIEIPMEDLPHIFERFIQGRNFSPDTHQGLGIGLAVVKELVELHKGNIRAECNPKNSTCFILTLPLGNKHLSTEEIEVKHSTQKLSNSPIVHHIHQEELNLIPSNGHGFEEAQILVVEDNRDMRQLIKEILEPKYKVSFAVDGLKGWEKAIHNIPGLIISDVMMSGMDGIELCKRLKEDSRTSHIPLILLTAKNEESARLEGLKSGADNFLSKPFKGEELHIRINNLLEKQRKIQQFIERKIHFQIPAEAWLDAKGILNRKDKEFIQLLVKVVEQNLDNSSFGVEDLSKQMGYSRVHLFRKLKAIADTKPLEFIQKIRLTHAAQLLLHEDMGISEVAYSVGFSSPSHFGDRFRRHFEMTPTEFRNNQRERSQIPKNHM